MPKSHSASEPSSDGPTHADGPDDTIDYQTKPDLDLGRDLTVDDLSLFQRFQQSADVALVDQLWEAEFTKHLKLCELTILVAARNQCYWAELPEHPIQDFNVLVARHLEEVAGFSVRFEKETYTVKASDHVDKGRVLEVVQIRRRTIVSWLAAEALNESRVDDEWRRREEIEEAAREAHRPTMRSTLSGSQIGATNAIWASVLDGKYVVEVQQVYHKNLLCIFALDGGLLHHEPTNVAFGADLGADGHDIATWEARAIEIISRGVSNAPGST